MKNKITEVTIDWIIIFFFITLIEKALFTFGVCSTKQISYILYMSGIISLILTVINFKTTKEKLKLYDILILILVLFGIISTIFSKEIGTSIFGFTNRHEGFFSLLSYYSLFLLATFVPKKDKEFLILMLLLVGSFETFYGIFQAFGFFPNVHRYGNFSMGLTGNSMFFGTETTIWLGLSIGKYLCSDKKYWFFFIILFSLGTYLSGAMSSMVGLAAIILFAVTYLVILIYKKKSYKKILRKLIIITMTLIGTLLISILINKFIWIDIKKMILEFFNITINSEIKDTYGTNRIYIWKHTLKVVPKYLAHGIGIDCFFYAFPGGLILPFDLPRIVDKAHNEFLQILVTEGLFALITYITFLINILKNALKNLKKEKNNVLALILAIIGYLAQSLFNISIITVAPIFYIILGLSCQRGFYENASR